jgi:hypothetical protein
MPRYAAQRELLRKAIDLTGLTDRAFARTQVMVAERTLRYWVAGEARVPGPVLVICRAMIDDPAAARALAKAAKKLQRRSR